MVGQKTKKIKNEIIIKTSNFINLKMEKNYKDWHKKKTKINEIIKTPFFHEREIWFCYIGHNIGFEQDGDEDFLRPIVIFRKFDNDIFCAIPLTKSKNIKPKSKKVQKYYFNFSFLKGVENSAILSQIKLIDVKRLSHHVGSISEDDFDKLKQKLKELLP